MISLKTSLLVTLVALAIAGQASAGLINGGFEDPIGSEWTFNIVSGPVGSWSSTQTGAVVHSGNYSLYIKFGPVADAGKAYEEQVITGLTPGIQCTIKGWIYYVWRADKGWAYIEALGGGDPVSSPAKGSNVVGSWQEYTLSQTADASGSLTVRLWVDKYTTTVSDKVVSAYFDDISVEPIPEPGSIVGLLTGLAGLGIVLRRRR